VGSPGVSAGSGASTLRESPSREDLPRGVRVRRLLARVLGYLRPYSLRGALALVCVLAQVLLNVVPILAIRSVTNHLTHPHASFGPVLAIVGLAFAATVLSGLLGVAETYLTLSLSERVVADLREQLFDRLVGQSVAYFTRNRAGDVMSRILNDVEGVDDIIGTTLLSLLRSAFTCAASIGVMLFLDWQLTLLTLAIAPFVALGLRVGGRSIYRARGRVQGELSELTAYLRETLDLSGVMLMKSFGREQRERGRFAELNRSLRDREVEAGMATRWITMALSTLQVIGPTLLLLAGGYLVAEHDLSLGSLLAFSVVAIRFAGAVQESASGALAVIGSLAPWQRIFDALDEPVDVSERAGARALADPRGAIALERVSFTYPGQGRPALREVSAEIQPGQLAALVGPSGAGKTTLSHLVPRFYDPQAGVVSIDGHDVRELTFASLAAAVGLVLQDTFLFHASLRENLAYGLPGASERQLLESASQANLEEVIAALPEGLDTVIGERGHRLSGGEKQRVAIARVILKNPPILIFDEATSHLDSVSERLIQDTLAELSRGRTSIVIAHRLSTILAADQIFVLDGGRIVERGTHEQLVQAGGLYIQLYQSQFAVSAG
jgi:ATP-binding cassette, subfamily B, bacterial